MPYHAARTIPHHTLLYLPTRYTIPRHILRTIPYCCMYHHTHTHLLLERLFRHAHGRHRRRPCRYPLSRDERGGRYRGEKRNADATTTRQTNKTAKRCYHKGGGEGGGEGAGRDRGTSGEGRRGTERGGEGRYKNPSLFFIQVTTHGPDPRVEPAGQNKWSRGLR